MDPAEACGFRATPTSPSPLRREGVPLNPTLSPEGRGSNRHLRVYGFLVAGVAILLVSGNALLPKDGGADDRVQRAESERIAVIDKVKSSVVAIFSLGGQGGGSGVLISEDGYALTNFHVVEGAGPVMHCGLPDGVIYDAVLVGLDRVGDVALIKLLPKEEGRPFPFALMGDSDQVKAGDWSLAMGNPFLLATDFSPTVTYGLVSGVHRYQYPAGTLLEYTDCIQVDTSINPGNSGGPLFNMKGELIGVNGRGSFEKRGRVNSGVGYAISINQIKNFMGHLRAGLDTDHATLGASIASKSEEGDYSRLVVKAIIEGCDANRRGLDTDDELVSFAGRPVTSVNQYKNVLGLFPKGWRVPLVYRRNNEKHEILVRLMQLQQSDVEEGAARPKPRPGPRRAPPVHKSAASKLYEPKPGFANFYFNKLERDRLLTAARAHGDFTGLAGDWRLEGETNQKLKVEATVREEGEQKSPSAAGSSKPQPAKTIVRLTLGNLKYELDPLKPEQEVQSLLEPRGSGGLLMALYQYRRFLTLGPAGFEQYFYHGGYEPYYRLPAHLVGPMQDLSSFRIDAEVLVTEHAAVPAKWYFSRDDHRLLGFEVTASKDQDPCEVSLGDYRIANGRYLPHRLEVRHGNGSFGVWNITSYNLTASR
jgi:serine protease Do